MNQLSPQVWDTIYQQFDAPLTHLDCGQYCAPYNYDDPICCNTQHVIPVMYTGEWTLLSQRTHLWHHFQPGDAFERQLVAETGPGHLLAECSGAQFCERENRTLACRAFPFFPYITRQGQFIGLSYYWLYEDRCWIISNLHAVSQTYRQQFITAFEQLFTHMPEERETYRQHSATMRRVFSRQKRRIPLLHRNGQYYTAEPKDSTLHPCSPDTFPTFAPFNTPQPAHHLPTSEEINP